MSDEDKLNKYNEFYGVGCDSNAPGCAGALGVAPLVKNSDGTFTIKKPAPPTKPVKPETSAEITKDEFDSYDPIDQAKYKLKTDNPEGGYVLKGEHGGKRRSRKRRSSKKKRKNKKSKKSRKAKKSRKSRK